MAIELQPSNCLNQRFEGSLDGLLFDGKIVGFVDGEPLGQTTPFSDFEHQVASK